LGLLDQKIAIITGSSRGLGLSIAHAYAREGAAVVLSSRSPEAVESAAAELRGQGFRAAARACDVADLAQVERLAEFAVSTFGRIDVWVNNAALSAPYGPALEIDPVKFASVTQTNTLGTYYGSMAALRRFTAQRSGKLINLIGRGADRPAPMQIAYGSSKAWILQFTRALAEETKGSGVEVLVFNPGMMLTDLLTDVEVVAGHEDTLKPFGTILRMWAKPPELAAQKAVWLASSVTDGRSGLSANIMTPSLMIGGLLREGLRRLLGRPAPPAQFKIKPVPGYKD
jgi:glucose 1-dehydrogenase